MIHASSSSIMDLVIPIKNVHVIILCSDGKRFNYAYKHCWSSIYSSANFPQYKYTKN